MEAYPRRRAGIGPPFRRREKKTSSRDFRMNGDDLGRWTSITGKRPNRGKKSLLQLQSLTGANVQTERERAVCGDGRRR